ncbi:exodeoxyribonuclease V subunit gamma [Fodinibius sp. AD559]|uniref:exodeoxyribonuclease V subunit gamma n=1 Tax=Fodinibius sp. AD559 TaxID=3424179 RepID=UPI0040469D16
MLKFYYGTKLEKLADRLFRELDEDLLSDPLAQEVFVVQNHGIGQWLSLRMAKKEGIAANLKFEFPSERIWSLIRLLDDDIPQTLPSDRGPMTWTLMELFEDEQFLAEFKNLRHYIEEEDPDRRSMRSWKLASKIADVFDQYLIYRPQMILDWEQRKLSTQSVEAEKWQSKLWRRLISHWQENYKGSHLRRAKLQQQLWQAIEEDHLPADELPDRITVFGVSSVSPAFIETMTKLSKLTEIHFYHLSVDPGIKEAEQFKNPLLQSLGKEGANFVSIFSDSINLDVKFAGDSNPSEPSLFTAVQSDLKNDDSLSGHKLSVPPVDQSIQVHNCHSPMREVEVLYDQLLALLDENPELTPDEILIMTPDIETYAPFIEAVFATPDEGQPEIPYTIADRAVSGYEPATDTFLKILELSESRFKVTDVLDLLDSSPIREAFGFTENELNRIEQWVGDNQIRWGIDGKDKKDLDLPESDHFTWRAGLRRILLGYAMRSSDDHLYDDIYAYHEVETSDDANLAGKMSFFLNKLFSISNRTDTPRKPEEWREVLNEITNNFLPDNQDYFWELSTIREGFNTLTEYVSLAGYNHNIPFSVVRRWLGEQLQQQSTGGGRIGRGVTFSSLMPMRSIPFNVIGMIGMGEGAFPRSKIPIEFDLMHLDTQTGDPVQSEQDRYLFLENLLSARSHIYFSYVGQSNRQDTDFPSSVVLREFLDYLEEYYDLNTDDIIHKHPLQAFSPAYYSEENLLSYSSSQLKISRNLADENSNTALFMDEALPEPDEDRKHLSVRDLVGFFQHPARFLLQNRLGVYLKEEEVLTEEREPFTLEGLSNYKVGQELLDRFFKEKPLESYQKNIQAKDMLPQGWSGERAFQKRLKEVREFGENLNWILDQQQMEDKEVDLHIGEFRLSGRLSDIYENARIAYRFGSMRPKDVIDLWIKHLCLQAVKPEGHPGISRLFTRHKRKDFVEYQLGIIEDYEVILEQLLEMYWQGLQQCSYFFPESTFAYAEEICYKNGDPESGLNKAGNKWIRDYGSYPGEGEDPYNKLLLGSVNPLQQQAFKSAAEQFWAPFFNAIVEEGA